MERAPLITGATGFAGSHLVDHLLEHEPAVSAWSNPAGQPATNTNPRIQWRAVDVLDRECIASEIARARPSVIYHCAGFADEAASWKRPDRPLRVNTIGTHYVLEGVRRANLDCPVLVTGSALIYRPSAGAIDEESPVGPSSPYGFSKLAQEMMASATRNVPAFLTRPFNHAGPRQSDSYVTSSFARQIAEAEAGLREPVLRVGNLESRRDITDVRDTVRAYRAIVERGRTGRPYNVCSGRAYVIRELLDTLVGMATIRLRVETDPARMRPSDNPVVLGGNSRIQDETGWRPAIPIERTLADLLAYWRRRVAPPSP